MAPSEKQKHYKNYHQCVRRKLVSFACPRCGIAILPKDFEKHCNETHNFDNNRGCVWCWGDTSWKTGEKGENSLHMLECFRKFISSYEISASLQNTAAAKAAKVTSRTTAITTTTKFIPSRNKVLCPGQCFFDHDSSYIRDLSEALSLFSILPLDESPIPYSNENVCLAASCVQKYLDTRDTHDWFHVMVKAVAFSSFVRALDSTSETALLPFSCWCDGGHYEEAKHRQHRHMVAVAPKGLFASSIWNRVDTDDRPCANYPSKGLRRIKTPIHLVNTLGYLSKRTSRCQFTHQSDKNKPPKENHFYIFTTLPVQYQLPLAILWVGGMAKLMYQQLFRNVSVESVSKRPLKRVKGQWRQKIEDFYALPRGLVLDVDRWYVPTTTSDRKSPHRAYLLGGRELRFELSEEPLDENAWHARQVEGGNCFYENVMEECWTPRKDDQEKLNLLMPRIYRIRDLEVQVGCLMRKDEQRVEENRQLIDEIRQLNNKIHEMNEEEIQRLKAEIEDLKNERRKCTCSSTNATTASTINRFTINNNNYK